MLKPEHMKDKYALFRITAERQRQLERGKYLTIPYSLKSVLII